MVSTNKVILKFFFFTEQPQSSSSQVPRRCFGSSLLPSAPTAGSLSWRYPSRLVSKPLLCLSIQTQSMVQPHPCSLLIGSLAVIESQWLPLLSQPMRRQRPQRAAALMHLEDQDGAQVSIRGAAAHRRLFICMKVKYLAPLQPL